MRAEQVVAVREALDRISRSDTFRKAPQLSAFLTFVVEKFLAGEAHEIKGYTIATQALGRSEGFDPQLDPIVRVEAGRLRRALDAYYGDAGHADLVRISIPRGGYVPEFSFLKDFGDEAEGEGEDQAGRGKGHAGERSRSGWPPPRPRTVVSVIFGLLIVLAAGIAWWQSGHHLGNGLSRRSAIAARDPRPVVEVTPVETTSGLSGVSFARLRDQLLDALARFEYLAVTGQPQKVATEGERYQVNLRLSESPDGTFVTVRLVHAASGRVAWVRSFVLSPAEPGGIAEDQLAGQIATAIATPGGALHGDLRRWVRVAPPVACLLRAHAYWLDPNPDIYEQARTCLEAMAAADPDAAIARAALAAFYLEQYRRGIDLQEQPLEKAVGVARRALEISPSSPRAHVAMMAVLLARQQPRDALQHGQRAITLNPFDTAVRAELGARYVQAGDYRRGLTLLQEAAAAAPVEHSRFEGYRFVGAYMLGDEAAARQFASQIVTAGDPLALTARVIGAALTRQDDEARALIDRLTAHHPAFAQAPAEALARYGFAPEIIRRLVEGLRQAGLRA